MPPVPLRRAHPPAKLRHPLPQHPNDRSQPIRSAITVAGIVRHARSSSVYRRLLNSDPGGVAEGHQEAEHEAATARPCVLLDKVTLRHTGPGGGA